MLTSREKKTINHKTRVVELKEPNLISKVKLLIIKLESYYSKMEIFY